MLGAGVVGVCTALALGEKGLRTALIDRRSPGKETSWGNAGLIDDVPHPVFAFPREPLKIATAAAGLQKGLRTELSAIPSLAGWLMRYWASSSRQELQHSDAAFRSLMKPARKLHKKWAVAAGFNGMHDNGVLQLFEGSSGHKERDLEYNDATKLGIKAQSLSSAQLVPFEPAIRPQGVGLLWTNSAWVDRPGALVAALKDLFELRGGVFAQGDAEQIQKDDDKFRLQTSLGELVAEKIVIALGPWSTGLMRRFAYNPPFAVKRGYSATYSLSESAKRPQRPIVFSDGGFVLSPAPEGVRLITGVEFARPGKQPSPHHLNRAERDAVRAFTPLEDARRGPIWMGLRPCVPDMLPLIGQMPDQKNIILATAHNHWGLTSAPATASIVADLASGKTPSIDPSPFDPARF